MKIIRIKSKLHTAKCNNATFTLESHYSVDFASLIVKLEFLLMHWRASIIVFRKTTFECYNQNIEVSSCSIPFNSNDLPKNPKIYELLIAPLIN